MMSCPPHLFLSRVAWPLTSPSLMRYFLYVFVISFTSFSVPLSVGGSNGNTLEVLIFQFFSTSGLRSVALSLALFQFGLLIALSFPSLKLPEVISKESHEAFPYSWKYFLVLGIAVTLLSGLGFLMFASQGILEWNKQILSSTDFLILAGSSFALALGANASMLICFLVLIFGMCQTRSSRIFRWAFRFQFPSTVLLGVFLLWLFPLSQVEWKFIPLTLGLTILFFPILLKTQNELLRPELIEQLETARVLGATPFLQFYRILWPQVRSTTLTLVAIGGIWAAGDFGLSRILFDGSYHLASESQLLLSFYHFDMSASLSFFVLIAGTLAHLFLRGVLYVSRI